MFEIMFSHIYQYLTIIYILIATEALVTTNKYKNTPKFTNDSHQDQVEFM